MPQNTLYQNFTNNGMKLVKWHEKSVELKGVHYLKRVADLPSSCMTSPDVAEIWNGPP